MNPDLDRTEGPKTMHGIRNGVLLGALAHLVIGALIAAALGFVRLTPGEWFAVVVIVTAVWSVIWGALTGRRSQR